MLIWHMDKAAIQIRDWRRSVESDNAVELGKRQVFSRVIERYLLAAEKRGWAVGVESAKGYIELVEEARGEEARWEEGREALRWLVRYGQGGGSGEAEKDWRGRLERRLRELQYAERTVET